jgi:hypothetical protein
MTHALTRPAADRLRFYPANRHPDLTCLHQPQRAKHLVHFYEDDRFIVENVALLAVKALQADDSVVLVATGAHLEQIKRRMESSDLDLEALAASGRYVAADATEALTRFMTDDVPDVSKFNAAVGEIVSAAQKNSAHGFVFAFGEMVDLLCAEKKPQAAVRLEQLWNSLAERYRFSLYCAYSLKNFLNESDTETLVQVCAEHAVALPAETAP